MNQAFRQIPKMDRLLERPEVRDFSEKFGQPSAVAVCRAALERIKTRIRAGGPVDVAARVEQELSWALANARLSVMQRVINATGVILHTNLGRAPYGEELLAEAMAEVGGACSVEIDMGSGRRGVRGEFVRETLARLCGAESALVVNNNAAALLLILSALAAGREVIVSRGELIQIGGGFRIPDIIEQGGAKLREVGTTNITSVEDYRRAMGEDCGALLKVHLSNFHQGGFTSRPSTVELAALKTEEIPFLEDLGSGNLMDRFGDLQLPDPTPAQVLADGADLVCFSGDKLLGGPQAGLIAGDKKLIDRLAKYPLMRAIRPDKFTYAMLQVILRHYEKGQVADMAPWRQLNASRADIRKRITAFRRKLGLNAADFPTIDCFGEFGAGSLPGESIPSAALVIDRNDPDRTAMTFRRMETPVQGIIRDRAFILDFLTVSPDDEMILSDAVRRFLDQRDA